MKQIHRVEQLAKAVIAVKVYLERVRPRCLPVVQEICSNLCGRAVTGRSLAPRGSLISGYGAEFDAKAHPRFGRVLATNPGAGFA
jgi:hypothetical protein